MYLLYVSFDLGEEINKLDVCRHEQASCGGCTQWKLAVKQLELNHWTKREKKQYRRALARMDQDVKNLINTNFGLFHLQSLQVQT